MFVIGYYNEVKISTKIIELIKRNNFSLTFKKSLNISWHILTKLLIYHSFYYFYSKINYLIDYRER